MPNEIVSVELQPRVVPTAAWIEREKLAKDDPGHVMREPADAEKELVVFVRAKYIMPSELLKQDQWPAVATDIIEIGRVNFLDLKKRVKAALETADPALAARVITDSAIIGS